MTVFEKVYARKWSFLASFTAAYFLTLLVLGAFGFTPWAGSVALVPGLAGPAETPGGVAVSQGEGELPLRVEIPGVDIRTTVSNPATIDVAALDAALLSGAVRYPGSGVPGEEGNVLIFGHSSHLPVVQNQAFRAFNDIQNLKSGDPVYVIGKEKIYIYAVERIEEMNTETGEIPLAVEGAKLTLATCNNFGSKEDRFVVTANLVRVQDLN